MHTPMKTRRALLVTLLVSTATATQTLWGQCGGTGYKGDTVCVNGATCSSQNPYYYQCAPSTAATFTTIKQPATTTAKTSHPVTTKTSTIPTSTVVAPPASTATQYFITFGDSYSQTGFLINGALPNANNPLGNPTLPGYTTSGGKNWIGNLITTNNRTLLLNYNFSYGGATTNATIVKPFDPSVLSFIDQVTEFKNSIASKPSTTPWTSSNALFGIWIGVNDVGNSWYQSNVTDIFNSIMVSYFGQMQILYNAGARKFVLLSVPPIQEAPAQIPAGVQGQAQELTAIKLYNSLLASNLKNFSAKNPGITAQVVDTVAPFQMALDNPKAYGAADATCYNADGNSCLWWNDYHPALAIQKLVAQAVAGGIFKGSFFS